MTPCVEMTPETGGFAEWDAQRAARWLFWLGEGAEDVRLNLRADMLGPHPRMMIVWPYRYQAARLQMEREQRAKTP